MLFSFPVTIGWAADMWQKYIWRFEIPITPILPGVWKATPAKKWNLKTKKHVPDDLRMSLSKPVSDRLLNMTIHELDAWRIVYYVARLMKLSDSGT